jgi:fructose-bisphosphate aldolase, class I
MKTQIELQSTIEKLLCAGKGILAADESIPTISKRFQALGIPNTEESRRQYRSLLVAARNAETYISGVILFVETLAQHADDGALIPQVLERRGIVPGIKVDLGTTPLANAVDELVTQGLDGLRERLQVYRTQGARFAKWRAVFRIANGNPTPLGIAANAEALARYAAICQGEGIVPIVEPEVLADGDHAAARCADVSDDILHAVFDALHRHHVILEFMLLKPNMVLPGKDCVERSSPEQVAADTLSVLRRCVPAAVPGICFLSGGQRPEDATANLNAMNGQIGKLANLPWQLSFSFGRALQDPVLQTWAGLHENVPAAQQVLVHRARMNALARSGAWSPEADRSA